MASEPFLPEDQERIAKLLYEGRKLEAIKLYRELTGQGLKEAKNFIDLLENELREGDPEHFGAGKSGCTVVASALILALVLWW